MSIEWNSLRPLKGSQQSAFEELCCQLAACEPMPQGSRFLRKGAPDAGVECYWVSPNGDEFGWQAKYFLTVPDDTQWAQIDESFERAVEKHPRLTSYTICLPIDRQDPRIKKQKWFMDKWNEHIGRWQQSALAKDRSVSIPYWGEHEIFERLSRDEHKGRYFFWFRKDLFSAEWFERRIEESISDVGPRYTPELNVDLSLASLFDGLGRTTDFSRRVLLLSGELRISYSRAIAMQPLASLGETLLALKEKVESLLPILTRASEPTVDLVDWNRIAELASQSEELGWKCISALEVAAKEETRNPHREAGSSGLRYDTYYLRALVSNLRKLADFIQSSEARLANLPALMLVGKAGTGKTHLLCDVAQKRVSQKVPTILLLGSHFNSSEPWSQMIRELGLTCSRDEFLGALEAAAAARKSRALILMDALNEGEGTRLWNEYLPGVLAAVSRYKWIGLGFTVRNSYEDTVVPAGLTPQSLIRETHYGFAGHEYQATRTFFDHYGIARPTVPLLTPEFENPLFLKLFCLSLNNLGLKSIPTGTEGITAVFDLFVDSVNEKLSRPAELDFDKLSNPVGKAIDKLAERMAAGPSRWLARGEAQSVVDSFLPRIGYDKSLFRHLIAEGLLWEDRFLNEKGDPSDGISLSYERFTDHVIAKYLLDRHLSSENPKASFAPEQPLGSLVKDEQACWQSRGLIEALSIQLPERLGKELGELVTHASDYRPVLEAFVDSLVWRRPNAFSEATLKYINQHVVKDSDTHDAFLNALLTVAQNPSHPYNARFLHRQLIKYDIADRDVWWSTFLHYQYGEHGPVDRLVDWAWSNEDRGKIGEEALLLCAMALAWFLTTPDRFLRDKATKALVSLLSPRINVAIRLLHEFKNVNDPYVLERLLAVADGCAMCSSDADGLGKMATFVYEWQFADGTPVVDILGRDYARGIVEVAQHRRAGAGLNLRKCRAPFKSEWPSTIPSKEELQKMFGTYHDGMKDEQFASLHLFDSVIGFEDFNRYIIGGLDEWSSQRLGEPQKPTRKEIYDDFVKSLANRQAREMSRYVTASGNVDFCNRIDGQQQQKIFGRTFSQQELEAALADSETRVRKLLGKAKLRTFDEVVVPYLRDPNQDECRFDLSAAQRWILKRVLDLGWTTEKFGVFDRAMMRKDGGRESRKAERIGKKYQWIALHELLARLSDNFQFRGERWSKQVKKYDGPWQIHCIRDIDPSLMLRSTQADGWNPSTHTSWFNPPYANWTTDPETDWLKTSGSLPSVPDLIGVENPRDVSKWLTLEGHYSWEEPVPPDQERYEKPRRQVWYGLRSYLCRGDAFRVFDDWGNWVGLANRRFPDSGDFHGVFLGEFYWARAFGFEDYSTWVSAKGSGKSKILVTTERYVHESSGYDCSVDDTVSILLPTKFIVDEMGLTWKGAAGCLFDQNGSIVASDPSVNQRGPSVSLISRDAFEKFLEDHGLQVVWTLIGEKIIVGGPMGGSEPRGRLEIRGVYQLHNSKVDGKLNTRFIGPGGASY